MPICKFHNNRYIDKEVTLGVLTWESMCLILLGQEGPGYLSNFGIYMFIAPRSFVDFCGVRLGSMEFLGDLYSP